MRQCSVMHPEQGGGPALLRSSQDVLTQWIVAQVSRVAPSPFSREVDEFIERYAPPDPEGDRQFRELALVIGHAVLMAPAVGLWGFVGWAVSGNSRPSEAVVRIGWGAVVALLAGTGLHLIRYYDAMIGSARGRRGRQRVEPSWPRASSDLDFIVQIAIGALAVTVGSPP